MDKFDYRSRNFEGSVKRARIVSLFNIKDFDTCLRFINYYLEEYPDDVSIRSCRAHILINFNLFDKAIDDLEYLIYHDCKDNFYVKLFNCYYHAGRYNDAYQLLPLLDRMKLDKSHHYGTKALIIRSALGYDINRFLKPGEYLNNQIIDYQKDEAIKHISKHSVIIEKDDTYFNKDVDLSYLYNMVNEQINTGKLSYTYDYSCPSLIFAVPKIGHIISEDVFCNYIKVIVLPHTKDIISMYPITNSENEECELLDYEYEKLFPNRGIVKKLTQIDKFNTRYKR